MIFLSYEIKGVKNWGILINDRRDIVPKDELFKENHPKTLIEFIRRGEEIKVDPFCTYNTLSIKDVEILQPIIDPVRNVICVGKNYEEHVMERDSTGKDLEEVKRHPVFFTKATNTINKPYGNIPCYEELTSSLDYEGELAVIIGKRCTNLEESEVMDIIFGYTILNDISARDIQKDNKQWFKGKSLDLTCPIGPYIVGKDEIEDPTNLGIFTEVNGEIRQNSNTKYMIRSISKLISILSKGLTLEPGDIIATGTPEGVGIGFNPPRVLKKGDVVKVSIDNMGYIENIIV